MTAPATTSTPLEVDAVVIGSGFAGLYALHKLRDDLGLQVQSFDNAGDVGGTWYWNRYPGARSDTEVTAYCYSFDRELYESWNWTERYPRQPEILRYLGHVADKYDLRRSIRFETQVESAVFDDATERWTITIDTGEQWSAQFLVEGVGLLSSTNWPAFPGQDSFTGEVVHTSRWPHEGVDLDGKRVGVIGTGSSGTQVITDIAPRVGHLTVFQRTPQYTVPAHHGPISPDFLNRVKQDYDGYWTSVLNSVTAFGFPESDVSAESVSPEERRAAFEKQWNSGGGFQFMFAAFNDIGTSRVANDSATEFIRSKIAEIVDDPETAAALTPTDLYAKRPVCDDGYYATFNRDNVTLVPVKQNPISEITPKGIRLADGTEHELDVIVFATGFDAVTGNTLKIDHRGRNGVSLADRWADRPRTHLGMMTSEFPNMFTIFGPMGPFTNQPPAHEAQVDWIAQAITHLRENNASTIETTKESEDAWVALCDEIAHQTLFPQVDSWINGANIPGKPKTVMFFMAGMGAYMEHLRRTAENGYEGLRIGAPVGS
ncbi:flavin-containing monooxygenase [Amycolatopsis sacchari]|uniref:flavin-containing monooxygenase n=1 Tax=Amycolatopsis sacchari TaxID=115433 RepID=UPI003EB69E11